MYRLFTILHAFLLNASYILHTGDIGAIKKKVKHHILPFKDEAEWLGVLH